MKIDTMELCLDISDAQILSNLSNAQCAAKAFKRLQSWELLSELMRRIAIDDLIEEVAYVESINLECTSEEFDKFLAIIQQSSAFEEMNIGQLSAIAERELKLHKFKQAKWGSEVEAYFQTQQSGLDRIACQRRSILTILSISTAASKMVCGQPTLHNKQTIVPGY